MPLNKGVILSALRELREGGFSDSEEEPSSPSVLAPKLPEEDSNKTTSPKMDDNIENDEPASDSARKGSVQAADFLPSATPSPSSAASPSHFEHQSNLPSPAKTTRRGWHIEGNVTSTARQALLAAPGTPAHSLMNSPRVSYAGSEVVLDDAPLPSPSSSTTPLRSSASLPASNVRRNASYRLDRQNSAQHNSKSTALWTPPCFNAEDRSNAPAPQAPASAGRPPRGPSVTPPSHHSAAKVSPQPRSHAKPSHVPSPSIPSRARATSVSARAPASLCRDLIARLERQYGTEGSPLPAPKVTDPGVLSLPSVVQAAQVRENSVLLALQALRSLEESEVFLTHASKFSAICAALSHGALLPSLEMLGELWEGLQRVAADHPAASLREDVERWFMHHAVPTLSDAESYCRAGPRECRDYLEALGKAQALLESITGQPTISASPGLGVGGSPGGTLQQSQQARMLRDAVIQAGASFLSFR